MKLDGGVLRARTAEQNVMNVYRWKPSDAGMTTKSKINRTGLLLMKGKENIRNPRKQKENVLLLRGLVRVTIDNKS